jgi:hypothetical protein
VRKARDPRRALEEVEEVREGKAQVRRQRPGADPAAFEDRIHIHVKVAQETRKLHERSDPLGDQAAQDVTTSNLSSKVKRRP